MPLHPVDAPSAETAALVALADRCVQCGLCLPHCPTYRLDRLESEGPRGRIAYAKAVAEGTLAPTETGDRHLDHCLGCRRCEQACPAGVKYEDLLIAARANQFARQPPPFAERAALAALGSPWLARVALPVGRTVGRLPPLPAPPSISAAIDGNAPTRGVVALFEGCASRDYEAGTRRALVALLGRAGWGVREVEGQGCCGTAAAHAGDAAAARALADRNRKAFATLPVRGSDASAAREERPDTTDLPSRPERRTILSLASGCQSLLAATLAGVADVVDALTFLEREGAALAFRAAAPGRVALHLPCSQRVFAGDAPLRRLLARIPGLDLIELPDTGCCGAAGLHMLSAPERAARLRAPLLEALAASGATQLLSANIGCRLHLGNAAPVAVRHPIDFLAEHLA